MTPSIVSSLFALFGLWAGETPAAQGARLEVPAVVERVQKKYDGAADFRAAFNQTLTNATFKRRSSSTGEVLLKKPGRMRWNYKTPETKTYVSDGDVLWLYEPEDKQAFKQELKGSQLPAALAFLTGKGKLSEEFDITVAKDPPVGTSRDYVLALSPKQAQPQVKSLLFVVDPDSFFVRETFIVDTQGNTNDILFSDVKVNVRLPESTFHFTPPAGVRIVDTNKMR